jgi:hypothetical protein
MFGCTCAVPIYQVLGKCLILLITMDSCYFQNQRTIISDYFKTLKKPGSFFIYLEIVENSDYIWEIVSFVQGEECVYILLDFSYFYSSLFSHLECHGSIKLSFTNHLLVSKVRVTSKMFGYLIITFQVF